MNQVSYFGKCIIFIFAERYANIKQIFDIPLSDLASIVIIIIKQIKDQLFILTIKYSSDKIGENEQKLNISIFYYFRHEMRKYALIFIFSY